MKKTILILTIFFITQVTLAQVKTIKGIVSDPSGFALPGVNVKLANSKVTTATNFDGSYIIKAAEGDVLVFTYIGTKTKSITVDNSAVINVTLYKETEQLTEVVVTALGIKRQKKELGYAVQDIKGDQLSKSITTNVATALSGKIAGVDVSMPATGVGGTTRVIIRGISSLNESNQPLYVVDGVPIDNGGLSNDDGTKSMWFDGKDNGDGISSINPDDIESLSVLKGAAAAALYGSRALNGVILVTTKKGKKGKLVVELNSGISFDRINANYKNFQKEYGSGSSGELPDIKKAPEQVYGATTTAWGPKFSKTAGQTFMIFDGSIKPYGLINNNTDKFFKTGITQSNGVSLSGGNESAKIRFSFNNLKNDDVIPKSGLERNNISINGTLVSNKFTFDAKANYIAERVYNRPALGDSPNNVGYSLSGLAPSIDQAWLKNYQDKDGKYYKWNYNAYLLNPYYTINETNNETNKNRFIGYVGTNYQVKNWLGLSFRTGIDTYTFNSSNFMGKGTTWPGREGGSLDLDNITVSEMNTDLIATISNIKLAKNLNFSSVLGLNRRDFSRDENSRFGLNIIEPGVQYISNFSTITENTPSVTKTRTNSVFGSAKLDYNGYLYAEVTGRRDYFSVIKQELTKAAFYPSASLGLVFSEAFGIKSDFFSYGKLRGSWAKVSNSPGAYKTALNYTTLPSFNGGSVVDIKNTSSPNPNLTFQSKVGTEFGLDLAFFKNRLKADISVYREDTSDQTLDLPSSATSGYEAIAINAGLLRNEGVEVFLSGSPIKTKDFEWGVDVNFAKNKNTVIELHPDITTYTISEARWAGAAIVAEPNSAYGQIIGKDFKRTPSGEIINDAVSGMPLFTDKKVVLGKGVPDWTAGLTNRFSYKGITLQLLLDMKMGMDVYSMTNSVATAKGLTDITLEGRDAYNDARDLAKQSPTFDPATWVPTAGYVSSGVVNTGTDANPVYVKNTKAVNPQDYWNTVFNNTPAPFIYDASYVKLREVNMGYTLPETWLRGTGMSALHVEFFARNLLTFSKNLPNIDPESMYSSGNGQGFEYGSLPSRKSYGFNIKVTF